MGAVWPAHQPVNACAVESYVVSQSIVVVVAGGVKLPGAKLLGAYANDHGPHAGTPGAQSASQLTTPESLAASRELLAASGERLASALGGSATAASVPGSGFVPPSSASADP